MRGQTGNSWPALSGKSTCNFITKVSDRYSQVNEYKCLFSFQMFSSYSGSTENLSGTVLDDCFDMFDRFSVLDVVLCVFLR